MTALIEALSDLVKTFCSGLVSIFSVPAQTLYASFGSYVFVLPVLFVGLAVICKKAFNKKDERQKLLNNLEKEKKR